jgi:biopolymer transport protein ExbB/TolQ
MKPIFELIDQGGPTIIAIMALAVVLYSRCFMLFLALRRTSRKPFEAAAPSASNVRRMQHDIRESFREQRFAIGAMIAAAPLLGLLGTVSGMVTTFNMLSAKSGGRSMEGLARGISEVLVATESGLMVALPALVFVGLCHGVMQRRIRELNSVDSDERRAYS